MKKYLLIVTVVAFGLSIAACSGKKSENATNEVVPQEQVAPASDETEGAVILDENAETPQDEVAEPVKE